VTFKFGSGTLPQGLEAEVVWAERQVNLVANHKVLCAIPISEVLLMRESVADEIEPYLLPPGTAYRSHMVL